MAAHGEDALKLFGRFRTERCANMRVTQAGRWGSVFIPLLVTACMLAPSSCLALPKSPVPIDFSYAGYEAGKPLPKVAAVLAVRPSGSDDTALIQGALDRVAAMPMGKDGFRGAVLLSGGQFHVKGQIHLSASGVVLRGAGTGAQGSTILAEGLDRRSLIVVGAAKDPALGPSIEVSYDVPAGGQTLQLKSVAGLAPGDHVVVRRPSTNAWFTAIGMTGLPGTFANQRLDWKPGSHDLVWDRTITAVRPQSGEIDLDAPITTALEEKYGGGTVARVADDAGPQHIGIEDLVLSSSYDAANPKDENHSWIAVLIDHAQDAWVRNVTARHFAASAVRVNLRGRRVTIEDCRNEAPIAEEGGYRRQSFLVQGQQVLVYRCSSEAGMNDFASGLLAGGPNVFLDCEAKGSLGASGSFEGWSSGVLYENVHLPDARLQLLLDFSRAQGAGWTAANSLIWNANARQVDALGPPSACNFVVNSPEPLYASELLARTGQHLEGQTAQPSEGTQGLPEFRSSEVKTAPQAQPPYQPVQIVNGRFVLNGGILWGSSQLEAWWRGDTSPYTAAASTGSSISRFMPGVIAPGETEDLKQMAESLKSRNIVSIQVNPGLWYDHRRDAHTVERRDNGDVWAPFYEAPWARSGKGVAWDGLSKFDVSRYNPWYFERQREFARHASEVGLLVFYDLYNTHNVLEIGPHWIDYAWRPANNINDTGLPEPPPLKPNGRNDVGNEFFSTDYAPLRALHHAYILHTLDELGEFPNVVFGLAYQYAGPLAFQQFFMDTVREWEQQHGKQIRIALITSKQTTDAILQDPVRSRQVAVIDMRYWEYRPDGSLFAPEAGVNRAFREQIAATFPGYTDTPPATTPQQVYRQVREYRDRYPDKALMPMEEDAGPLPILMAGAASRSSLQSRPPAAVPTANERASAMYPLQNRPAQQDGERSADGMFDRFVRTYLAKDLAKMSPQDGWVASADTTWVLAGDASVPVLIDSLAADAVTLARALPANRYKALWYDPRTGLTNDGGEVSAGAQTKLPKPNAQEWLLMLSPIAR